MRYGKEVNRQSGGKHNKMASFCSKLSRYGQWSGHLEAFTYRYRRHGGALFKHIPSAPCPIPLFVHFAQPSVFCILLLLHGQVLYAQNHAGYRSSFLVQQHG